MKRIIAWVVFIVSLCGSVKLGVLYYWVVTKYYLTPYNSSLPIDRWWTRISANGLLALWLLVMVLGVAALWVAIGRWDKSEVE